MNFFPLAVSYALFEAGVLRLFLGVNIAVILESEAPSGSNFRLGFNTRWSAFTGFCFREDP
jgi:hypothetical protein